jgi:hypothetical protein
VSERRERLVGDRGEWNAVDIEAELVVTDGSVAE